MGDPATGGVGRGAGAAGDLRARRRGEPSPAVALHPRSSRQSDRRGRVRPCMARADAPCNGRRRALRAVACTAARRAGGARGDVLPSRPGRERHAVSVDDDLRERARASPACDERAAVARVAFAGPRNRLRSARAAGIREALRADRHGNDRAPGRIRRAREHHACNARCRWRMADHRPQMVLLRAAMRRAPRARAGRQRHRLLPDAAHPSGRDAQFDSHQPVEGQARQSVERVGGSGIRTRAGVVPRTRPSAASRPSSKWSGTRGSIA